jgi:hypothetical protein
VNSQNKYNFNYYIGRIQNTACGKVKTKEKKEKTIYIIRSEMGDVDMIKVKVMEERDRVKLYHEELEQKCAIYYFNNC